MAYTSVVMPLQFADLGGHDAADLVRVPSEPCQLRHSSDFGGHRAAEPVCVVDVKRGSYQLPNLRGHRSQEHPVRTELRILQVGEEPDFRRQRAAQGSPSEHQGHRCARNIRGASVFVNPFDLALYKVLAPGQNNLVAPGEDVTFLGGVQKGPCVAQDVGFASINRCKQDSKLLASIKKLVFHL